MQSLWTHSELVLSWTTMSGADSTLCFEHPCFVVHILNPVGPFCFKRDRSDTEHNLDVYFPSPQSTFKFDSVRCFIDAQRCHLLQRTGLGWFSPQPRGFACHGAVVPTRRKIVFIWGLMCLRFHSARAREDRYDVGPGWSLGPLSLFVFLSPFPPLPSLSFCLSLLASTEERRRWIGCI